MLLYLHADKQCNDDDQPEAGEDADQQEGRARNLAPGTPGRPRTDRKSCRCSLPSGIGFPSEGNPT
jgi:hypothetical protein